MTAAIIRPHEPRPWSLEHACKLALEQHWAGMRKAANARSWCRMLQEAMPGRTLYDITTSDIQAYIHRLQASGLAPWTVHARVCVISTVYETARLNGYDGPVPHIPRPHVPKPLKWWLTPEKELEVIQWLRRKDTGETTRCINTSLREELADFVMWTVLTGLRVEESLRAKSSDFHGILNGAPEMCVPGTKTGSAQAMLALSSGAGSLALARGMATGKDVCFTGTGEEPPSCARPLFSMTYHQLDRGWQSVREQFGWLQDSTATLKALRRSFARRVFANGAPLPVVQGMMRHKDPQTTLNYLRLVGGAFTTEEQRKWL